MINERRPDMKIGVAFYSETEWDRLRELAPDPEVLEETYAEWRKVYEEGVRKLAASGLVTEPVEVSVDDLQAWCADRKRPLDGKARAEFVSQLVMQRSKQTPPLPHLPRFWRE